MAEYRCSRSDGFRPGAIVASFQCGPDLSLTKSEGLIANLLECDTSDLLGTEWRKYTLVDDLPVTEQIASDLAIHRPGAYRTRHISKSGDRLLLRSVTLTIAALGLMRGTTYLEHIESARTHVHVSGYASPQPVTVRRNDDFVIDLKPAKES